VKKAKHSYQGFEQGVKKRRKSKISLIDYDTRQIKEKKVNSIKECFPFKNKKTVTWINIDGIQEPSIISELGKHFGYHPLLLEDIMNTQQRPKVDDYNNYVFIVLKMLYYNENSRQISVEQVSFILGKNYVISFQEHEGDVFESVRSRLRNKKGQMRSSGADYLIYALLDAIVDNYFSVLEKVGEHVEDIEDALIVNPTTKILHNIYNQKQTLIFLRRAIWPVRDLISSLERMGSSLMAKSTVVYLRDVYDHAVFVIETIETYRDMVAGMLEIYLSSVSNKMNEVMKVLTVIATVFIPLTFITGVYGMNFNYMPEITWKYGYFIILFVMFLIAVFMFAYFHRKKWV